MITALAPASTANLGPGFDAVGVALDLWNELVAEESEVVRQLADLGRGQPVDVQDADRAVSELDQAGEQVLVVGVDAAGRLGVDPLDVEAEQEAHDVVEENQDVPAAQFRQQLGLHVQFARRLGLAAITGGLNQRDPQRQIEPPHQVREEHQAAGQDRDDCEWLPVVIAGNLPPEFIDALLDFLGGNQNVNRHGGPLGSALARAIIQCNQAASGEEKARMRIAGPQIASHTMT